MKRYGLIGKKLSYSFSKIIHEYLFQLYDIQASYELIEINAPSKKFLLQYDGLNVTIPFKEEVLQYLDMPHGLRTCNTIKNDNEKLSGYDTDTQGFAYLVQKLGVTNIQRITILGSGAMSKMIQAYFSDKDITVISRTAAYDNYQHIAEFSGDLLINATPIGMGEYESPVTSEVIQNYRGVIDLNYNPIHSALKRESEQAQVPFINGLYMLVVQAIRAFEIWEQLTVSQHYVDEIYHYLLLKIAPKVAIIGMSLSGKTTFITKYQGIDLDQAIIDENQASIASMIEEGTFRSHETSSLKKLVAQQTPLIALGGGAILKSENMDCLKDYVIVHLHENLATLKQRATYNFRPLIKSATDVEKLYNDRINLYRQYAMIELSGIELDALWSKIQK